MYIYHVGYRVDSGYPIAGYCMLSCAHNISFHSLPGSRNFVVGDCLPSGHVSFIITDELYQWHL